MIKKLFVIGVVTLSGLSSHADVPNIRCEKQMYASILYQAAIDGKIGRGSITTLAQVGKSHLQQGAYIVEYYLASANPKSPEPQRHRWQVFFNDFSSCSVKSVEELNY